MTYKTKADADNAKRRYFYLKNSFYETRGDFIYCIEYLKYASSNVMYFKSNFEKYYQSNSQLRNRIVKKLYDLSTSIDNAEKQAQNIISQIDLNIKKCTELIAEAQQQFDSFVESEKTYGQKLIEKFLK